MHALAADVDSSYVLVAVPAAVALGALTALGYAIKKKSARKNEPRKP